MNLRATLFALALCLGAATSTARAVTCAANMAASNPDAAYTDHGDGTVTHVPTGLMWKRCSEGQSWDGSTCTGVASTHTWAGALALGHASSFADHADWRLPNLKELRSLVEECRVGPAINDTIFPATPSSDFRSGSPYVGSSYNAWVVNFNDGYTNYGSRSYVSAVRLVRGGQSFGSFDSSNGVALSATTLNFAAQNLGMTSAAQTVTLRNNGGAPLNIADIAASGDYAVAHNCGAGLGAGGFCTLDITFTPAATGARTGAVTITDDSTISIKTIALTGTGQGAVVSLSATTLYFASQNQGSTSAAQTVTLTNPGGAALNIGGIAASGDFARTTTCGATLAMGASCTISVTFTPTAEGASGGSLVITSNANSSPDTISLSGTGLAAPVVSLSPASLSFAAQNAGTSSAPQTIALTNTGAAALTLASIAASGDFAVTNNCGGGLGAGGFCSLSVIFTPTLAGTRTGAITITSNAAGSPRSAGLSGTGAGVFSQSIGAISFSPATLVVGGTTTASAVATSGLPVTFSTASASCTATGANGRTITGVAAGSCIITASQAGNASYNPAPQVTQNITVGKANQTIAFGAAPAIVVGGTGTASATATSGLAVTYTSTTTGICTVSGSTVTGVAAGTCTVAADQAGNANYNAATRVTQNITVVKANQTIGAITFAPATLIAGGTTLASATGGASGLPVTFTTASPACTATGINGKTITGIAAGACIINANQAGNASYNAATPSARSITVSAAPVPAVSLNRTALIFAARRPGTTSPAQAVTLTNTGASALNLTGIVASGDFARTTTCAATLAAGASCTINVTFTATAMGARAGLVTLTSNAAGSPHRITLTGTGKGTRHDFNGDGKSDILWRNTTTGANQIWFMNGGLKSSFANTTALAAPWAIAGVDDFNGDGKADILWRSNLATGLTAGANQIWLMNGAIRTTAANTTAAAAALAVAGVADFNGDGKTDILWRNAATGQDWVWLMNGAAVMAGSGATSTLAAPWTIAGTGDFNADGKADILWRNPTNGLDSIWFMNGKAAAGATTNAAATVWSVAGVADFNGDGKADITWRSPATGATQLWLMNGAVRSAAANLTPLMLPPWSVAK